MQKPSPRFLPSALITLSLSAYLTHAQQTPLIIRAEIESGQIVDFDFVNAVVGWNDFFLSGFRGGTSSIGILEAGQAWFGHEAFTRPQGVDAELTTWLNPATGAANQLDYHATTVAHVLAGSGNLPTNTANYTVGDLARLGMAPEARVVSGGIATSFSNDPENFGAFDISTESLVAGYKEFFRGTNIGKLDVINSSWGGDGDGSANSPESLSIDGLAFQNPTTAHVISAGNGNEPNVIAPVSSPANGFNNISVGSLGGTNYDTPSSFSSNGLVDFYNPVTQETITNARVAVDIAAPGEDFFLAAYLGNTGSIGAALPSIVQEPSPTGLYFNTLSGTSYSAPIVAGGIALLKDVARAGFGLTPEIAPDWFDTRTIKSVIMAGSDATAAWDNGQNQFNVTTQALDTTTGAGSLNLLGAANIYLGETLDSDGGTVGLSGWAMTTVDLSQSVDFVLDRTFNIEASITVAINWFAVRDFDDITLGEDIAFANLDLQVWKLDSEGNFSQMVGASQTLYNNTEFLRLSNLSPGRYGMRVLFTDMIYDTTDSITSETFALAWTSIPEPDGTVLIAIGVVMLARRRKR